MASQKVQLPFDRPFDKLTVLSKVEGLTALSKAERLRCAASIYEIINIGPFPTSKGDNEYDPS